MLCNVRRSLRRSVSVVGQQENQSPQRANDSAELSDMMVSILNSRMAESLDEDKEVTCTDVWQERPVLCENVSVIQKDIVIETSDSPH